LQIVDVDQCRYLFVRLVSIDEVEKGITTYLKQSDRSYDTPVVLLDSSDPLIFSEKELQEWA
jgi:hypothetical protein